MANDVSNMPTRLDVKEKKRQNTNTGTSAMPTKEKAPAASTTSTPNIGGDSDDNDSDSDSSDGIVRIDETNLGTDETKHVLKDPSDFALRGGGWEFKWRFLDTGAKLERMELRDVTDAENIQTLKKVEIEGNEIVSGRTTKDDFFTNIYNGPESWVVNLNLSTFADPSSTLKYEDYLSVRMTFDGDKTVDSDYFALIDSDAQGYTDDKSQELNRKIEEAQSARDDGTQNPAPGKGDNDSDMNTGTSDGDDADPTEIADSNDSSSSPSGGGGGGGGLPAGTIAGIVVGIVVFLALIGGLVFFLLRRRRKNKHSTGYADPRGNDPSNAYIVDKIDTSAQSPRSPYSDDGQEQHTPLDPQSHQQYHNRDGVAAGEGSNGSEYAGLYQANQQDATGEAASPRLQSRSNTGNYSHLVEDGMTADDIRRLEEEERQLDAEIERHGRR